MAKNLGYFHINTWRRGVPSISPKTGKLRGTHGIVYNKHVVSGMAYRGCCILRDESTGIKHDYRGKGDQLVVSLSATQPGCGWSKQRQVFSNALERKEKRHDARVLREIIACCPHDMKPSTFIGEVTGYIHYLSRKYKTTVYADIHDPSGNKGQGTDPVQNLHVHICIPTRVVTPEGLGEKIRILDDKNRSFKEVEAMREEWARAMTHGFKQQGDDAEFDHRGNYRRGIERLPQPKLGRAHAMESRGVRTERQELINEINQLNEYLHEAEIAEARLEKNIESLEKLAQLQICDTSCAKTSKVWNGKTYDERLDLDINNTIDLVEKLHEKALCFEDLLENLYAFRRISNEVLDWNPVIEDIPRDTTLEDILAIIGQELSYRGIVPGRSRTRTYSRDTRPRGAPPSHSVSR